MNTHTDLHWPFGVRPLSPNLGAEISGVNLAMNEASCSSGSLVSGI